jgi:hypothetical protein
MIIEHEIQFQYEFIKRNFIEIANTNYIHKHDGKS